MNFREAFLADKVMVGAAAGLASTAARLALEALFAAAGWLNQTCALMAASMFLPPSVCRGNTLAAIAGALADLTIGSTIGVLFIYFIYLTGRRFIIIKGAMAGTFFWVAIFGALRSWRLCRITIADPGHVLVFFLAHLFMGLILGALVERFGQKALNKMV